MKNRKRLFLIDPKAVLAVGLATTVFAAEPLYGAPSHQGRLTNPGGDPVEDGYYDFTYELYDTPEGDNMLWTDTYLVNTSAGLFTVQLDDDIRSAFLPEDFDTGDVERWLQVIVNGEELQPRIRLSGTAYAYASSRQWGDIVTDQGSMKLPISDGSTAMEMTADEEGNNFNFRIIDPYNYGYEAMQMMAEGFSSSFRINLVQPPDALPALEMFADGSGSNFSVNMVQESDAIAGLEIFAGDGGVGGMVSVKMFNPQPEPPMPAPLIEFSTNTDNLASIRMFNPLPEPSAVMMEMNSSGESSYMSLYAPDPGGQGFQALRLNGNTDGGGMELFDDVGKYMGFDPSPFLVGGAFYMNDPSSEITNVWIESSGRLSARMGIFGHDVTNNGNYNLAVGANHVINGSWCFAGGATAQVDHSDCFVWSDYSTTAPLATTDHNQFLVRCAGGTIFYSNNDMSTGVELIPGTSSWSSISVLDGMRNVRDVAGEQILHRIKQLPIKRYRSKSENESSEHIGPIAADFNRLFNLGQDNVHIAMRDESGVALAGVKALLERIEQLEARIAELEAERR